MSCISARALAALQGRKRNAADTGPRTDELRIFFVFFLHLPYVLRILAKIVEKIKIECKEKFIGHFFVKIRLILATFHFLVVIYLKYDIFGSLFKKGFLF